MATYADQGGVAISNRSWHHIKASGPWADELLDKLTRDNLPDGALALLGPVLDKRKDEQQERSAARRALKRRRPGWTESRSGSASWASSRSTRPSRTSTPHGRWTPRYSTMRQLLASRRDDLTDAGDRHAEEGGEQPTEEP